VRRIVIAGTGTSVGKSYVTRCLRAGLGESAIALKPIETGYVAETSDAAAIAGPEGMVTPLYCFDDPVSVHLAARRAGTSVDLPSVVDWVAAREAQLGAEASVIESAGGLFSPLDDRGTDNCDLIRALAARGWVLVAPNRLGVLHDVRATLGAALARHASPTAIVLSGQSDDPSVESNAEELRRLVSDMPIFEIPQGAGAPAGLLAVVLRAAYPTSDYVQL
jgi:dethiobiotin synthetase